MKIYSNIKDIYGFCHWASIFFLLVMVSSFHPGKSPLSFSLTHFDYNRVDFTFDSSSGYVAQASQSEYCFPTAVVISFIQ